MPQDVVISASNLGKAYAIYNRPEDRLKQMLWQFLWRGKKKYYDEFWALKNVNLEVTRGETVGIVGRNGSGKSTLLQDNTVCSGVDGHSNRTEASEPTIGVVMTIEHSVARLTQ